MENLRKIPPKHCTAMSPRNMKPIVLWIFPTLRFATKFYGMSFYIIISNSTTAEDKTKITMNRAWYSIQLGDIFPSLTIIIPKSIRNPQQIKFTHLWL